MGYQREAARCPVSLADMELTDAATQRLRYAATVAGRRPAFALRPVGPTAVNQTLDLPVRYRELRGPRRAPAKPAAEEIVQHIRHCGAGNSNITEGHTGDIFVAAKSRKMAKHIAGVCIAEHEPWITLVGYAALELDMNPLKLEGSSSLL